MAVSTYRSSLAAGLYPHRGLSFHDIAICIGWNPKTDIRMRYLLVQEEWCFISVYAHQQSANEIKEIILDVRLPKQKNRRVIFQ
ncbi:UNVERIFIED_CONTAM: hypothetical protein NCL1_51284 [Trichonephila clavipes]